MTAFLSRPSAEYKESFIEAVREFHAEGRHLDQNTAELERDFGARVQDLLRRRNRETQDTELVPETILWLIDDGEYIGRISIRHEFIHYGHIGYDVRPSRRRMGYGTLMLKLALAEAREIGLDRVCIVCDAVNEASVRIIEANGGELEAEESATRSDGTEHVHRRYWIELAV